MTANKNSPGAANAIDPDAMANRVTNALRTALAAPLDPGLYLVATPIGHLGDITLRGLSVLALADTVYCEDTRHSVHLLKHFAIDRHLRAYHEHNAEAERGRILHELELGRRIALISDAGTPLVSDPGYKLVREAAAAGHNVVAIPGASSVLTALLVSGLPTDAFFFAGFLPPKEAARRTRIAELAHVPGTLVIFEAPNRVAETLSSLAETLGERSGAVARELTKLHEEVRRGSLHQLARALQIDPVRGEAVILVGARPETAVSDAEIERRLIQALQSDSLRDSAKTVADMLGVSKARVYDIGLGLQRRKNS